MTGNYGAIGGSSPLTELTQSQGRALEEVLGDPFRVFVGMRNWNPFIEEVAPKAIESGAEKIVGLPMAPQFSSLSVGKYLKAIRGAVPRDFPLVLAHSWYAHPGVLDAFADKAHKAFEERGPFDAVIFTAHSLPERVRDEGDVPYPAQVLNTAQGVADRLGLSDWSIAYQSAGRTPEPWLGPDLVEKLSSLSEAQCRRLLVVPVGFVCDHTEILFDIDIQAKQAAGELGMELVRSESLNCSPVFIRALADIVRTNLES
jgi:ferrochelatase